MEAILVRTIQLRHQRLLDMTTKAEDALNRAKLGIAKDELTATQTMLKNTLTAFNIEFSRYSDKHPNPDMATIDLYNNNQMKAEDLLTQIEILFATCEKDSEHKMMNQAKLPKLDIAKYDGNVLNWTAFWDRFEANVHTRNIADVEKLSYLLSLLEGSAYQAVEGLRSTNLNYSIAVDILKSRFGDQRTVVDAHNEALQTLKKAESTASGCRKTLDTIEKHLRVLEARGETVDGSHLRVIIMSKFPENVLYQVNLATDRDATVTSIRKALDTVVSALERSEITANPLPSSSTPSISTEALHVKTETRKDFSNARKRKWLPFKDSSKAGKGQRYTENSKGKMPPIKRKRSMKKCAFCDSEEHYSEDCPKHQTYKERQERLRDKCYICFRSGHLAAKCTSKWKCPHCEKRHNRALCPLKTKSNDNTTNNKMINTKVTMSNISHNFLQTAVTQIRTEESSSQVCRILLDSGSQRSYMTTRLAKRLNVTPDKEDHLIIYTFGSNKPKEIPSPSAEVTLITKRSVERKIRVNIVSYITDRVPVAQIESPATIDIRADDDSTGEAIDVLIGNDLYFSFMRARHVKLQDHVYFVDTDFGWIISGSMTTVNKQDILSIVTYCQCHETGCPYFTEPDLPLRSIDVKFLWNLESIGIIDSPKTTREENVVKHFNETTIYNNGRYEVKWPWIQFPPNLPTNFGLAYGRLKSLLKRSDHKTIEEYSDILKEQLQANIIEEVPAKPSSSSHPVHYLPHHMVKQDGKKGRLVYDASAKIKDQMSLIECLYSGPCMLEDLTGLLLKFRMGKVGITADVEKAFLQVGLQEDDREVTRFLWVKDPTKEVDEDNLIHYRFCRVPFGIISSPFLLTATIRLHLSRSNESLLKEVADKCYVDNLVMAVDSTERALQIHNETRNAFDNISMNVRDWMSNDQLFLKHIPEAHKAKQRDQMKILGLLWNMSKDTLELNVNKMLETETKGNCVTKKDVLRTLARLYDPCGFVSPLILRAKLLFQELCARKLKWDAPLPVDLQKVWQTALDNLEMTKNVKIPRYVGHGFEKKEVVYELHCFTDASKNAYAAVAYLRIVSKNKRGTVLLMSKTRVTPMEDKDDLKIPRLELLAYLIGSRLLKYIKSHLSMTISNIYLWTDSQVVLAWMKSNKLLPPFVLRRVNEIKQTKEALGLISCYVNTKENPADIATRPEMWSQKLQLWLHGPRFLAKRDEYWPEHKQSNTICLVGEALDIPEGSEMTMNDKEEVEFVEKDDQVSSMEVCENMEKSSELDKTVESLTTEIKKLQKTYFQEEVIGKETSLSRNLSLFLDVDGVLRSRGRMSNANWSYDKKYPILIPKDSSFTNKVIQKVHEDNYHVGVSHTLSILREKYWIPQGRAQVSKTLRKCPQCEKHGGGPYRLPPIPPLPAERVNYSTPYTFTGLDYLGPILVDMINGTEKRWICLLTCLAVRAVHLEIVKDLTAEECLLAMRRFTASKGSPQIILSDNAQQFKLTSEVLTSSFCTEKNIRWKFITPLAPWQGGLYERLVALVKHCMKRTLDKHLLNDSQLLTVIKEIEAVINTRPLTAVGSELEEVLRPADFLSRGECIEMTPTLENSVLTGTKTKVDLIQGWKRGQMILEEYKRMFVNQYLPSLRERDCHTIKQPRVKSHKTPQIGDIVQLKEEFQNRTNWRVGKIITLIRGRDGEIRGAKVKIGDAEFTRSLAHLYPLEAESHQQSCTQTSEAPNPVPTEQGKVHEVPMDIQIHAPREIPLEVPMEISAPVETDASTSEVPVIEDTALPETDDAEQAVPSELVAPGEDPGSIESREVIETAPSDTVEQAVRSYGRRDAAIRAREKIAEWTRQLLTLL